MEKPLYITLDLGGYGDNLVKRADEDYKTRTFGELLEYMSDGEADELNETGYNAEETMLAETLTQRLEEGNKHLGNVNLYALSNDDPPEEIYVGLSEIVADYNTRILKTKEDINEEGDYLMYHEISLLLVENASGGKNLEYNLMQ